MQHKLTVMVSLILLCVVITACGPSAQTIATQTAAVSTASASQWTKTPTALPSITPTPKSTDTFESKSLGISIEYPKGWTISEEDIVITIENNKSRILLFFFPAGAQSQNNDNPILALESFIQFAGYAMPDKEWVHLITLNGSEFAFGAYSNPGEGEGFNNPSPLFMAMHFTENYTIAAEFDTTSRDESENRKIFESVLASLPPSPPRATVANPTLAPNAALDLSMPPKGFYWQGVENIEFAIPVPEGWFVKFSNRSETWQNGLQEYDYQYFITKENLDLVGKFSSGMVVIAIKNNSTDAAESAKNIISNAENSPSVTKVIDTQRNERGSIVSYHLQTQGINADADPDDSGRNRTLNLVVVANINTNILYVISFDSSTETWEQEWAVGQILTQMLLEFLQE